MKIAVLAFSTYGAELATKLLAQLAPEHDVAGYCIERHAVSTRLTPFVSVGELTEQLFDAVDALVFFSASGIAVRAIAPHIKSKLSDPAVVVCDETGRFAISLLSGHAGGANKLAEQVAAAIAATPVITTASDSHAILNGTDEPQNLVLGIGCRAGLSAETVERAATIMLWDHRIALSRVRKLATITVKRNDEALLGFAKAHNLPINFYTAEELAQVEGEFTPSQWVLEAVGVDNVCERAAVLCGGTGKLIVRKTIRDGVTVALFETEL